MGDFFVRVYDFFERRKALLWITLLSIVGAMTFFALKVRYNEQITGFFRADDDGTRQAMIFDHLKMMDKIIVMFSSSDPDASIGCAEAFEAHLMAGEGSAYIGSVMSGVGSEQITGVIDHIYGNLPVFLGDDDYARLDSLTEGNGIEKSIEESYTRLSSPVGMALRDIILQDPLGIASGKLAALQGLSSMTSYEIYDGHIFSPGLSTMIVVIEPTHGIGDTGANEVLVSAIELSAEQTAEAWKGEVQIAYFGGPSVAVHNARIIKSDTLLTLAIALTIIAAFILLTFRNRWAILLIVTPVIFGALFALSTIWLTGSRDISAIAIGAGAAVFGIALSYSIHVISHANHTSDPRRIIRELAYPLTVGSITTIGAFLGLLFTGSQLLGYFGLFAALTLVGTTLFCLIFLPHFLSPRQRKGSPARIRSVIEKISGYSYDRNKVLVGTVIAITFVCFFFYGKVGFDSDIMNLNYMPPHLKQAEEKLNSFIPRDDNRVLFVTTGPDFEKAHASYLETERLLNEMKGEGIINGYTSISDFLPPPSVQRERIGRWNAFWSGGRREETIRRVADGARANGFRADAFDGFADNITRNYTAADLSPDSIPPFLADWVGVAADGTLMLVSHVGIPDQHKDEVYSRFEPLRDVIIVDRGFYASRMAQSVKNDFYLTLSIATILIFIALLISYGRIELTLMAFMPMFISWIIILGLMAILGIEFNIVNIILSTFIFGIGDDFSIFIMDGLLAEYKDGKKMLAAHKTAILFSAFTIIVGLGVLILAKHPAIHSLALISILGILTVIFVSYVLQPVVFRMFISYQTRNGGFPYTLGSLLNTLYAFLCFLAGCLLLQIIIVVLYLIPAEGKKKKIWFHRSVCRVVRFFLRIMVTTRRIALNDPRETFEKPAVIIANHQSFIDILVLLSLCPKLIMVTNSWVWRSPFFGRIVRYADFYHTSDGYDKLADEIRGKVKDGYSVVVFPEGTRSADMKIKRFHKGAFYLAAELRLDILPVVLYGNGLVSSKRQPIYIKKGLLVSKVLERITPENTSFGTTYGERAKKINAWFKREYDKVYEEYNRACNPYFFDALMKNYTYKGPVLEWYMRVKVRMEKRYDLFDRLIPRDAAVVDIGCGYGALSYMLTMLSDKRRVLGIDYDEKKIALAAHCFSHDERTSFVAADALEFELPPADVFILNDVLHYLDPEKQETLLQKCFSRVADGGMVVVREGDAAERARHRLTERTEKWSTKLLRFNKTSGALHFTSSDKILAAARNADFRAEIVDSDRRTSNKTYVIRRGSWENTTSLS